MRGHLNAGSRPHVIASLVFAGAASETLDVSVSVEDHGWKVYKLYGTLFFAFHRRLPLKVHVSLSILIYLLCTGLGGCASCACSATKPVDVSTDGFR